MTVKYVVVTKRNLRDLQAAKKYYPVVKSTGRVTLRQLADQIAAISTVSSIDLVAILEAFLTVIPQELAEGNIVDLGEFGSFRLQTRSQGSDSKSRVTARNITKVLVGFLPGKRFKKALRSISFKELSD